MRARRRDESSAPTEMSTDCNRICVTESDSSRVAGDKGKMQGFRLRRGMPAGHPEKGRSRQKIGHPRGPASGFWRGTFFRRACSAPGLGLVLGLSAGIELRCSNFFRPQGGATQSYDPATREPRKMRAKCRSIIGVTAQAGAEAGVAEFVQGQFLDLPHPFAGELETQTDLVQSQ